MTRQVLIQSPAVNRRQSLLSNKHAVAVPATSGGQERGGRSRLSEAAGRTAADCAALSCCCPCTVMNILVLAVYKVPAGLCRKASMRKRQRAASKKRAGTVCQRPVGVTVNNPDWFDVDYATEDSVADLLKRGDVEGGDDAAHDLEREMWDHFHGAGFGRSPSMRGT